MTEKNINSLDFNNTTLTQVYINGEQVVIKSIKLLIVRESIFELVPRMELHFMDSTSRFSTLIPLQDRTEITVKLSTSVQSGIFIEQTFELQDYDITELPNNNFKFYFIRLTARLKCKTLIEKVRTRAFPKMNSSEVIKQIGEEHGLKVNVNVNTKDQMTWLQYNIPDSSMIQHCLDRSYVDDTDSLFSYVDRNGELNVTSMHTQLKKPVKTKMRYVNGPIEELSIGNNDYIKSKKNYLNYFSMSRKDISSSMNEFGAYKTEYTYYDTTESFEDKPIQFTAKTLDSNSDGIILLGTYPLKNKNYRNNTTLNTTYGLKTKNMHSNYFEGKAGNLFGKCSDLSSYLDISIMLGQQASEYLEDSEMHIKLFDIIELEIPVANLSDLNPTHSGKYFVGSIALQTQDNLQLVMKITLFRNAINIAEIDSKSKFKIIL